MGNKANDAKDLTDDVATRRKQELDENFPPLKREDFASTEEYRNALLSQYRQLRQQQYESICLSEGTTAFDAAVRCNGNMNRDIFNKKKGMVSDSLAYRKIAQGDIVGNASRYSGSYCCAVSACAVEAAICERMGVESLVKCDADNLSAANLAPFPNDLKISGKGKKTLWNLIEQGKVGPGDQISRDSNSSNSGKHAEVIVAVNYDENGKLKNYVIQANNRTKLQVIDANTQYPPMVTRTVKNKKVKTEGRFTVGRMYTWMGDQLNHEIDELSAATKDLTPQQISELENKVAQQRAKATTEIDNLQKAENHLFGLRTGSTSLRKMIDNYADSYIKNANVPSATPAVMRTDAENAGEESSRQERRLSIFHVTTATNEQRESSAVQAEQQTAVSTGKKVVRNDEISARDRARMKSMLTNLNKVSRKNPVDIEATIDRLTELYGTDASKVLTKIMMSPSQFSQRLNLRDENGRLIRSSRGVLEQLCIIDNEEQNKQILAIASSKKRSRGGM